MSDVAMFILMVLTATAVPFVAMAYAWGIILVLLSIERLPPSGR